MRRRVSICFCLAAIAALVAFPAAARKAPDEPPAATPSVTLNHDKVPIGSPVKITTSSPPRQNAPDIIKGEDTGSSSTCSIPTGSSCGPTTTPPVPARRPGSRGRRSNTPGPFSSRTIRTSAKRSCGSASTTRRPGKRLTLSAQEASRKEYVVSKFQLLPQSENVFLIYKDGWHPAEVAADNAATEWQWTKKTATISFRNPKKDLLFYLEWDARPDLFTPPQQVTLTMGGQDHRRIYRRQPGQEMMTFPITAAQLGTGEMAELVINVNRRSHLAVATLASSVFGYFTPSSNRSSHDGRASAAS